ncbi:hypothetical protein BDW62DRAFT_200609 [Aspergillus aurantiobrunneus]
MNSMDRNSRTPFIHAISHGLHTLQPRPSQPFEDTGAQPDPRSCCRSNDATVDACRVLLEYGSSYLDSYGLPGYAYAFENNLGEILQFYIDKGLVADAENSSRLLRTVQKNFHSGARALVAAGCDTVRSNEDGLTPLELAWDDEMVKILYSRR